MNASTSRDVAAVKTLCDGTAVGASTATNRGLHYGDGVFRTVLIHDGRAVDWSLHLRKLEADCEILGLDTPAPGTLEDDLAALIPDHGDGVLKTIVVRAGGERGYAPSSRKSQRWVLFYPSRTPLLRHYTDGISVIRSAVPLSEQPLLAGVKHLNRLDQVLASRNWPAGIDEALMLTAAGDVICGTRGNVFAIHGERLLTPRLDRCGVAGIMRQRILEAAAQHGITTTVAPLKWTEVLAADELFVCNAVTGIVPIGSVDGDARWSTGDTTRHLARLIDHPCHSYL